MPRSVVITGLGVVSGFGVGVDALWQGLVEGRSAIRAVKAFDPGGFACRLASEVPPEIAVKDSVPKHYRKATKVMARDSELAVIAAHLAVTDAKLRTRGTVPEGATGPEAEPTFPSDRTGCQIGAGLIAAETDELTTAMATAVDETGKFSLTKWGAGPGGGGGMNNLTPLWMLKYLPNMLACHVTIIHGCEGPSNTITCSEASGLLSVGESVRVIQRGSADVCFSGGAEAPINLMRFMRMTLSGRLAATGEETDGANVVRPFDANSRGTVLGDGAGILILEEAEAARARGAEVYAMVAGFGAAHAKPMWRGDGTGQFAETSLDGSRNVAAEDEGVRFAIEAALDDAGLKPEEIDAIVPHGSGIASLDAGEWAAMRAVFGDRLERVPMVLLTPAIGSCLAGHGALAAAVGAMIVKTGVVPGGAGGVKAKTVLVAGGSLGGHAAALVLKKGP